MLASPAPRRWPPWLPPIRTWWPVPQGRGARSTAGASEVAEPARPPLLWWRSGRRRFAHRSALGVDMVRDATGSPGGDRRPHQAGRRWYALSGPRPLPSPSDRNGAPARSRTRNLMGRNHLLYPVELQGPDRGVVAPPDSLGLCHTRGSLVAVAQLVERRDVAPEVAGSSPVGHPLASGEASELSHRTD